jgi:hypothetical protein
MKAKIREMGSSHADEDEAEGGTVSPLSTGAQNLC